jgi:hypothetical protein
MRSLDDAVVQNQIRPQDFLLLIQRHLGQSLSLNLFIHEMEIIMSKLQRTHQVE